MRPAYCGIADLRTGQTRIETLPQSLEDGRFGFGALRELWQDWPEMTALSAGMLTGTGAPGSGGMLWSYRSGGQVRHCAGQGRLAAALRWCGLDHLVILGVSGASHSVDVVVTDNHIALRQQVRQRSAFASRVYAAVRQMSPGETGVIAVLDSKGILEDQIIPIGSRAAAQALRRIGVRSVTVCGTGGIDIAHPEEYLSLCGALWRAEREKNADHGEAARPAAYLSAEPCPPREKFSAGADAPLTDAGRALSAAMGIYPARTGPAMEPETMRALAAAYLGEEVTASQLERAAGYLTEHGEEAALRERESTGI